MEEVNEHSLARTRVHSKRRSLNRSFILYIYIYNVYVDPSVKQSGDYFSVLLESISQSPDNDVLFSGQGNHVLQPRLKRYS